MDVCQGRVARTRARLSAARHGLGAADSKRRPHRLGYESADRDRAGVAIELTAFEYKILEYLMLNRGKVVSKTELTEHIYDQDFDRDSNVMEVLVGRLRRKLDPQNALVPIETLRGRGYRFDLT